MTVQDFPLRYGSVRCLRPDGFYRIAFTDRGDLSASRVAVCAHGLTRNSRDFDWLSEALARNGWRVICPDMPGRGDSDFLRDPSGYSYPLYLSDMSQLLAWVAGCTGCDSLDWIGTSMGGLIGMMLAAQPGTPLRRLVLNDIGPFIGKDALGRIVGYVSSQPAVFSGMAEAEATLRANYAPFGPLPEDVWQHLLQHSLRQQDDGSIRSHYDPAIALPLKSQEITDVNLWGIWSAVTCPVLSLRGGDSDIFPEAVQRAMQDSHPGTRAVSFAGIGHAPMLATGNQINPILDWLLET